MKTPKFWNDKGIKSTLLLPIGWIYSCLTSIRIKISTPRSVDIPVICVGNLTAGGTGKTPVSIYLGKLLKSLGYNPFYLSRGYGGRLQNVLVSPIHNAKDVGDEPLLLAKHAPVMINANRYQGAVNAQKQGADIIIMDDGFQNPSLKKDISFIVVDGKIGFGNNRPIPSGPLRETLSAGIKRADALIILGNDDKNIKNLFTTLSFTGSVVPEEIDLTNKNVVAFAGIGRPEKFYDSLKQRGANIIKTIDFPDHHYYTDEELQEIIKTAKSYNAEIYTTTKDLVKIPQYFHTEIKPLNIDIQWNNEDKLVSFIRKSLSEYKKS